MNNGSDKGQKKAQQKRCNHVMEEGTLKIHKSKRKDAILKHMRRSDVKNVE